jgi:hypothetical protein
MSKRHLLGPLGIAVLAAAASSALAAADQSQVQFFPDDHGPAGVMLDHMHEAGEFMIGYRFVSSRWGSTMLEGSEQVDDAALAAAGFAMVPDSMAMQMHMLDLMYAPTDWLTLMAMPQYMTMDMGMREVAGATPHEGEHGGHGGGAHSHGTAGIGDTSFTALVRLFDRAGLRAHAGIGISAPTGAVDEKGSDGRFVHYGMQLGSGTWDLLPSLTFGGGAGAWGWGGQIAAVVRLEQENDSGFRFGDQYQATLWASRRLSGALSGSARVLYTTQGAVGGHYNGPHHHASPPDLQANYGGDFVEIGLGLNAVIGDGGFAGNRLGVEVLIPVFQDVNGFQQEREPTLFLSWALAI